MGVFFNGHLFISPTTASVVNDDAMRNQNLDVGNVVALVGKASGGQPKTALRYGSPDQAKADLISGELLDAVYKAFNPSSQVGGPVEVIAVRVNPATQASATLKDAAVADCINLLSTNYGQGQNQIKYKVEAGSTSGLRLTTQKGSDYYTADNIARRALSVLYGGASVTATITITGTSAVLAAPAGTTVQTIQFADFATVGDLVDRINGVAGFTATVLDSSDNSATLNGLDYVTAADCKTSAYVVRADLQSAIDWFNSTGEGFVTATRATGAGAKPAVIGFTFLSGGSDGTTTNNDWADGFEALESVDIQWVTPITSDASIHAMTDAHVAYMSDIARRERRAICGMAIGTSDVAAIAAAKLINSDRTSLVHIGHYDYDTTGKLALYPAYMTAAIVSGAFSGVNPGTPLTNKSIKVRGLERDLRNPTDTDQLILGGVLCVENTPEGYKVVKSISTCLWSTAFNRVEQSTGTAIDFVLRNVRDAVDILRGQKGNPLLLDRAVSITDSTLRELARPEPQGPGVLAGTFGTDHPPYRNITAALEGDVVRIQFEASPVVPANYVLVTCFAVPFSGVATSA